ncbi:DUF7379 domain-containing protein [Ramlibacter sp. AN1133]|uniref:DUF7379 domain-containing protein n=1 Tax=Ramlibacter sp. AN1133 TaxID=3133429 RepID=UPI0030C0D8C5
MAMQRRASGVWVDARAGLVPQPRPVNLRLARRGGFAPPAPAGARRRGAAPPVAPMTEEEAVVNAMEGQDLELVEAIPFQPPAAPARRGARAAAAPAAAAPTAVDLAVPVGPDERAVILVDHDGCYEWKLPQELAAPAPAEAAPPAKRGVRRGAPPAVAAAPQHTDVFHIELPPAPPAPAAAAMRRRATARGGLATKLGLGKAVFYVFRFIARPVVHALVEFLEKDVSKGLVHIRDADPLKWTPLADTESPPVPAGRPARVLLMVHGTFSSTMGSYGDLATHPAGRDFLAAALEHYDLILGWDHPTLSVLPTQNAIAFATRLERMGFAEPPIVDAVSYSRGALVLRSLVEQVLPSSRLKLQLRRAVFVGATNGGTELANPDNWHRLADRYTNLAAAGARAAGLLLPAAAAPARILAAAIQGIGVLVKALATGAVTDQQAPGLAAMEPAGEFIRDINGDQPGQPRPEQTYYCAITSDFDPDLAQQQANPEVMPPGLLMRLADKAADALFGQPNDLVVHIASMTQIDEKVGKYIRERFDFGKTGVVHHCAYFSQPQTAQRLLQWLQLGALAAEPAPVVRAGVSAQPPAPVVRLRSTQAVKEALQQVKSAGKPWIVIERRDEEHGRPVTLRYAHPAPLGEAWLKGMAKVRGATVHDAFDLHESGQSRMAQAGAGGGAGGGELRLDELATTRGSAQRTIELRDGEPVNVISPEEVQVQMAPAPAPAARRRAAPAKAAAKKAAKKAARVGGAAAAQPATATGQRAKPPAAAAAVECHFRAETDDEYVLGQVHTVDVTIARELLQATGRRAASKVDRARVSKARPLIVECIPALRVSLVHPEDARVEVAVPEPGTPLDLRFDVQGNEAGSAQVRVQVRQGPIPLVTLVLDLQVVQERSGTRRSATASAGLAAFPRKFPQQPDELRIHQVQPLGAKTQYQYELELRELGVRMPFESPLLDGDPAATIAGIHKDIEDRWAQSQGQKEAFARDLLAIGARLFDALFPRELQDQLWEHRDTIGSVQVISSEPFIPWELVNLRDPRTQRPGRDSVFLGELGVVRWLIDGYAPDQVRIRKGKVRYLVPEYQGDDALAGAQDEIAVMRKRGGVEVPAQAEEVYKLLETPGSFDLLHVACHGATDADHVGNAQLVLPPPTDGSGSQNAVLAETVRYTANLQSDGDRPMVVLNACQSARAGYALKGLGGFAAAFIHAGVGVFVGSSWSIGDQPAYGFARELYAQFIDQGAELAAASAAARRKAREDGDATWLAYAVYGHPRAVAKKT